MATLLPGISAERLATSRLAVSVLSVAGRTGPAVLFVHGNVSSSLFWQPTMLALAQRYRPLAIDLRGFGDTDPEPVDATRGLRDARCAIPRERDVAAVPPTRTSSRGWPLATGPMRARCRRDRCCSPTM